MKKTNYLLSTLLVLALGASAAWAERAMRVPNAIWVDGQIYDTVATSTSFRAPPARSTDLIYSFMMSGLAGQRSVAEAGPGDRDYNGGRWTVKMVIFTDAGRAVHDADGDGQVDFELTSEEEVLMQAIMGYIQILDTNIYFECPVIPQRK